MAELVPTYDAAILSAAEIVAPSIVKDAPDLPIRALREGMCTAATKDAILEVTGGATELSAEEASIALRAAAALLKERRAKPKVNPTPTADAKGLNDYTAEDINALNAAFYAKRG